MGWPMKVEHGREVIDGDRLGRVELVVTFWGVEHRIQVSAPDLDRQPVTALDGLARDDVLDLISGAHYEHQPATPATDLPGTDVR